VPSITPKKTFTALSGAGTNRFNDCLSDFDLGLSTTYHLQLTINQRVFRQNLLA
jgi:hypothetical protein